MTPVVVIGGGAAGMLAAWRSASLGAPTLLLEKKHRLGTKILISGGGKCNLTHAGTMESLRQKFRANEGRFLRPSFYRFTNEDYLRLLTDLGMEVYTRPDGRIFPVPPADAHDVVALMETVVRNAGVTVRLETPTSGVATDSGGIVGVDTESGERIAARQVIIATGGSSFPATGCTGDGWRWLGNLGHTIVPLRAALAPLYLDPTPSADWSGVALRDCVLKARAAHADGTPGRERMRWRGDLLFTHKGVSGPTALGVSREVAEAIPEESLVEVDLLPDEPHDRLTAALIAHCRENPRRSVSDFTERYVPHRLVPAVFGAAATEPSVRGAHLGQKERNRLVNTLKAWPLGRVRHVPLERGEVVAGGVSLDEVDPQTMRSKIVRGLYLCGEVLDIAGPVGGYNLQAAWSTGFVAGETAARDALSTEQERT
ncbi:MAG: aminoacetone oxidase family FAD-binding enzyme [Capsulimonadales bacterium]|nr:aminoacetone oxidase family FAD-binding enzyme [Capsulimonadales bacterium]